MANAARDLFQPFPTTAPAESDRTVGSTASVPRPAAAPADTARWRQPAWPEPGQNVAPNAIVACQTAPLCSSEPTGS